jgi:hypothetical protein
MTARIDHDALDAITRGRRCACRMPGPGGRLYWLLDLTLAAALWAGALLATLWAGR